MDIVTLAAAKEYTNQTVERIIEEGGSSGGNGGTSLKAGDLIEIKDGVISSTLGRSYTTVGRAILFDSGKLVLEDSYIEEDNIEDGKIWAEYYYEDIYQPTFLDIPKNEGEITELDIKYYPPNSDDFVVLKGLCVYYYNTKDEVDEYQVFANVKMLENGDDIEIIDPNYPLIQINAQIPYRDDETDRYVRDNFKISVVTVGYGAPNISGARIIIDKEEIVEKYVTLPDNALRAGDLIEIKDGIVSSTLGRVFSAEKEVEYAKFTFTPEDYDDYYSVYYCGTEYEGYDSLPVLTKDSNIKVEIMPSGATEPMVFDTFEIDNYETSATYIENEIRFLYNCTYNDNRISKKDESLIAFVIQCYYSKKEEYWSVSAQINGDISEGLVTIFIKQVESNVIKLPNTALTFDGEPTEGSENLVSSGVVYNAIQDAKPKLIFDNIPTQNSKNLVSSGTVHTALQQSEAKVPTAIANFMRENPTQGANIGKRYPSGDGEIFNDYNNNIASSFYSHAEGYYTASKNSSAHAEGEHTTAGGVASHTEGYYTIATGGASHAEGHGTKASGEDSHSQGYYSKASGDYSHAEGYDTEASGSISHAEGDNTIANGEASHVEGYYTIASGRYSHVQGKCNVEDTENKYAHIIGNGKSNTERSNAHTVDWEGNAWYSGEITGHDLFCALTPSAPFHEILSRTWEYDISAGETNIFGNGVLKLGRWYTISLIKDNETIITTARCTSQNINCGSFILNYDPSSSQYFINIWFQEDIKGPFTVRIDEHENSNDSLVSYVLQLEERIQTLEEKLQNLNTETIEEVPLNETY